MIAETTDRRMKYAGQFKSVQVVRRCPHCGRKLYEKLGRCDGTIQIKCPKCGRYVSMNLALRKMPG